MRPARKRKLVDEVCGTWGVSIRRVCRVLLVDTSTYYYRSRRAGQAGLEHRIREICETRVRYGYRRVHVMLRREGWMINQKRTRRIYRELGLQLRNKTPKRRVKAKLRDDRTEATRCNQTWAMDFVHDQLATGRKLRVLTIVDIWSRFSPAVDPRFSYRGEDVVATLERVCREHGYPQSIRVDQGSEFISRDLDLWAYQRDVVLDFSRPHSPCFCHGDQTITTSGNLPPTHSKPDYECSQEIAKLISTVDMRRIADRQLWGRPLRPGVCRTTAVIMLPILSEVFSVSERVRCFSSRG